MTAAVTPDTHPSPWIPETDPRRLKALGKLAEELGECSQAVARCIIQGVGEAEPVTGKLNKHWLEEEIADVEANLEIVKATLGLNENTITIRRRRKFDYIWRWLSMIPRAAA